MGIQHTNRHTHIHTLSKAKRASVLADIVCRERKSSWNLGCCLFFFDSSTLGGLFHQSHRQVNRLLPPQSRKGLILCSDGTYARLGPVCQSPAVHHTPPCGASKHLWCPPFAVSHISDACCSHLALSSQNPDAYLQTRFLCLTSGFTLPRAPQRLLDWRFNAAIDCVTIRAVDFQNVYRIFRPTCKPVSFLIIPQTCWNPGTWCSFCASLGRHFGATWEENLKEKKKEGWVSLSALSNKDFTVSHGHIMNWMRLYRCPWLPNVVPRPFTVPLKPLVCDLWPARLPGSMGNGRPVNKVQGH